MKELTIQEKASRYDDAIKRIENIKTGKCETTFIFTEGLFEHIFPDLQENEDEKIRKEILDTLEAKEVNLEKELVDYHNDNFSVCNDGTLLSSETGSELTWYDYECIAKHFFELGLKAQHDNWKVVDNINPPQADRNKIYCVFTKGRYILAKVICDPQDDDLLQWKCTEFPFHRYDMCEGDKYMQIV